jgi:hypothetical protein
VTDILFVTFETFSALPIRAPNPHNNSCVAFFIHEKALLSEKIQEFEAKAEH